MVDKDLQRYDRFGWDYEVHSPQAPQEIRWYGKFVEESEGSTLELACGSARLLVTLGTAGHATIGMDASSAMLAPVSVRVPCSCRCAT